MGEKEDLERAVLEEQCAGGPGLHAFIEPIPVALAIFDREMRYLAASQRWLEDWGLADRNVIGLGHYDLLPQTTEHWKSIHRWCLTGAVGRSDEESVLRPDGSIDWLRWEIRPWRDANGGVGGLVMFTEFITERKRSEEALRAREAQYRTLVEQASDTIALLDTSGELLTVNTAGCEMLGWKAEELIGTHASTLFHPDDQRTRPLDLRRLLAHEVIRSETRLRRKKGGYVWTEMSSKLLEDGRIQLIARDISERKRAEQQIRSLAFYDGLTGLPNRQLFQKRLSRALDSASRSNRQMGLLFLDLDRFKEVNDTLGHSAGDRLLCEVAQRLLGSVRLSDYVARPKYESAQVAVSRLGGDEFTVMLTEISEPTSAALVAQRFLDSLSRPIRVGTHEVVASASVGIAIYPFDGEDAETLLRNADTAMYKAKSLGRNNYQFYTSAMSAAGERRLYVENLLRRALERESFSIYYQPLRDVATGRLSGAEALIRMDDSEGPISPSEFILVAEDTGLIIPIGEWVLRTACRQWRLWRDEGFRPIRLAVNLSAHQLREPGLVESVWTILQETGHSPHDLELEITESAIMQESEVTLGALNRLADMGIGLALDDFGTGYSSLSYLRRFPLDRVKIDRSFVSEIATNPDDAALTAAIIAMAHSLRLSVVAEGVEHVDQVQFLREQGCDEVQGFLFSPAVPPDEFRRFLEREKDEP